MTVPDKTPLDEWIKRKIRPFPDLQSYRLSKLKDTIDHARTHSPFYSQRLAPYRSHQINSIDDFEKLPFTTADDLATNPGSFLSVSQDKIDRVVTLQTSGTTGECKRIFFAKEDLGNTMDFFRVGMSTFVGPGDNVLILLPWKRPASVGDLLIRALSEAGVRAVAYGLMDDYRLVAATIASAGITSLVGIPIQVLGLAKYVDNCWKGYYSPLKSILLTTDYVSPSLARYVSKIFGCEVFNHYGTTEMGYGAAVDCRAHQGYHLRETDLYLEIVNPHTKENVPDGTEGEIVFTTLTRRAMPLIRYATGDISAFSPAPCPCGTRLRQLNIVKDRLQGQVALLDGTMLTISKLDDILFSFPGLMDYNARATIDVREKVSLELDMVTIADIPEQEIEKNIREYFAALDGLSLRVKSVINPYSSGKRVIEIQR